MKENVLAVYYPRWKANCLESARWLRSGKEYEDFCSRFKTVMRTPEERELKAQEYEARAARYDDPNYTGA